MNRKQKTKKVETENKQKEFYYLFHENEFIDRFETKKMCEECMELYLVETTYDENEFRVIKGIELEYESRNIFEIKG